MCINKNEGTIATRNVEKFHKNNIKGNKPDTHTKEYILHDSISVYFKTRQNYPLKEGAMIGRGHEGFWGTGNVYFFYLGGGDKDVFIFSISLICVLMIWTHFYMYVIHKFKIKSKKRHGRCI